MTKGRDYKREHFKDRATGKFQQNTYDKFRKNGRKLTALEASLVKASSDLSEEIEQIDVSSGFAVTSVSIGTNHTMSSIVFEKTARAVIVFVTIPYGKFVAPSTITLKRNGSIIKAYTTGATAATGGPAHFTFIDQSADIGSYTYTVVGSGGLAVYTASGTTILKEV